MKHVRSLRPNPPDNLAATFRIRDEGAKTGAETISPALARRIALAAQGFSAPRPAGPINLGHVKRIVDRLGLLQIDSVNVAVRAHYMPLFSRLGPYPTGLLDRAMAGRSRALVEYWAHEASLLPLETWPLMRWRMDKAREGRGIYKGLATFRRERPEVLAAMLRRVEAEGPLAASDVEGEKGPGGWWGWGEAKRALEALFWAGELTTAHRRSSFERVYDLPARVLPAPIFEAAHDPADARRALMRIAARALGIGTLFDLRDYFRLSPEEAQVALGELVEADEILPVRVKGWKQPAYLHPGALRPRWVRARALLAPFDPLVWERDRTERVFDFFYRIEIYVPAEKRLHGYYVYPFLLGDRLVGRVDLKADRQAGALKVQAAHAEPHAPPETAEELYAELAEMARWLGLERVEVAEKGDLAPALRRISSGRAAAAAAGG